MNTATNDKHPKFTLGLKSYEYSFCGFELQEKATKRAMNLTRKPYVHR